jgi:hypothetical protein
MRCIEHHCSGICASSLGVHCPLFQDSVVASSSSVSGPLTFEVRPLRCLETRGSGQSVRESSAPEGENSQVHHF